MPKLDVNANLCHLSVFVQIITNPYYNDHKLKGFMDFMDSYVQLT